MYAVINSVEGSVVTVHNRRSEQKALELATIMVMEQMGDPDVEESAYDRAERQAKVFQKLKLTRSYLDQQCAWEVCVVYVVPQAQRGH